MIIHGDCIKEMKKMKRLEQYGDDVLGVERSNVSKVVKNFNIKEIHKITKKFNVKEISKSFEI